VLLSLSLLVVAGLSIAVPASAAATTVTLGKEPVIPTGSIELGPMAANTPLNLDIVLAPRDPAALDAFLQQIYDPASPGYHHFLAKGQFGPMFGAAASTVNGVASTLTSLGLTPGQVSSNDLTLPVSTTVAGAEAAFGVQIHQYRLASGRVGFANTSPPKVPSTIAPDLISILGLSDVATQQPLDIRSPTGSRRTTAADVLSPNASGPTPCAAASDTGYSHTADQLAHAYGLDTGAYASGRLGAGETVALFELEPFSSSDISAYESCYGVSTTVNVTTVDGGAGTGTGSGEAALDIEDVAGLAPDATIDVYEAPNTSTGLLDEYTRIADDNSAQVVSSSWGLCEPLWDYSIAQSEETVFEQMATQGQSMLAAAGDSGSEACYQADSDTSLSVQDPASDPYVTGVGGTDLTAIGPAPTETVWNESAITDGAGGGGISEFWQMPSWQQALGVNSDSSGEPCGAPSGSYCREVPDVAASADPQDGYAIYFDGSWTDIGGTSAASPLWAALTALADEGCSKKAGFLNPALYAHEGDLNDITSGNNDYTGTNSGLYPATAGYDMASGLGTPTSALFSPGVLCTPTVTLVQGSPTSATVAYGAGYSGQSLFVTNASGTVSYSEAASVHSTDVVVSGTGAISAATSLAPGTYAVGGGDSDISGDTGTWTFSLTVSQASQTVTFTAPSRGTVNGSASLSPTTSSGLAATLSVDHTTTKDACSISGNTVRYLHAGSCVIDANQAGDADYLAATQVQRTITVGRATTKTALKLSAARVTYGDEQTEHLSVTVSPQFPGSMPTGTVTVTASTGTLLWQVRLSSGKGSCRLLAKRLNVGTYRLVATYRGSTDFEGSTSVKKTLTVVW
jgi:subtilase family serine protease